MSPQTVPLKSYVHLVRTVPDDLKDKLSDCIWDPT